MIQEGVVSQALIHNASKPWLAIPGATSEMELDWLHMNACNKKLIYEIGSFLGRSTVALLESGSSVVAVDDFYGNREDNLSKEVRGQFYREFLKNTAMYSNLSVLKIDHEHFIPDEECDMVFIDGSHLYDHVVRDIKKFIDRKDILICGHDFMWWNSVREAVVHMFPKGFQLIGPNLWYVKQ